MPTMQARPQGGEMDNPDREVDVSTMAYDVAESRDAGLGKLPILLLRIQRSKRRNREDYDLLACFW